MSSRRLRVAVVDDSTFIRKAIARMLGENAHIEVVGTASCGEELLARYEGWRPDVVTLDLDMPGMGGLATLDRLCERQPAPAVIILSTHSGEGAPLTIEALHRGAADFIDKQQYSLVDFDALRNALYEKIFEVAGATPPVEEPPPPPKPPPAPRPTDWDLVVLGASTGGPPTLQRILEHLGPAVPAPVVVVQHMPVGFTGAFAERLNAYLPLTVREAQHGEPLLAGSVYIAVAGRHLRVSQRNDQLHAELGDLPVVLHVPSIDVLFESAAASTGRRTLAGLLTGMGHDGAEGLLALRRRGAHTFCQDEASSVVFGMPRAALALDAVAEVGSPDVIGRRLRQLLTDNTSAD